MRRVAFLALILAGVLWGLGFPLGKLLLREMDASHMVLLRFLVAAVVAAPFALATPSARALFRSPVMLASGVLYGLAFVVQFEGLAHVSVTLAALLVGAMPALIAVCARVMGEHVSRISWLGVGGATLGAVVIAGRPEGAGSPLGVALSLGSLLIYLAWVVLLKRLPKVDNPMAIPAVTVIVAAVAVLPVALVMHGPPRFDLSPTAWSAVLALGVLSTLVATGAWQYGSARVGGASAGVFLNLEPLMGASIGVLLFGDHLTLALGAGGALIIAGSFAVVLGEKHADPDGLQAAAVTPS